MNINGALIHRTPEDITFTNTQELNGDSIQHKRIINRYKFKKIHYYFRDGNMIFL